MSNISFKKVLEIHSKIFESIDPNEIDDLVNTLLGYRETGTIVGLGAGRMGYSLRSFIMRLSHLGFRAYMIGDTSLPRIGSGDLVIVNSSSGNTPSVLLCAEQAKRAGAMVISLCASTKSRIADLSDKNIHYMVERDFQLMKTSYEQFSFLFWDFIAQKMVFTADLDVKKIEYNHSILE